MTQDAEREARLVAAGYPLEAPGQPKALYRLLRRAGDLLYSSGAIPLENNVVVNPGRVPSAVPVDLATRMAALCAANVLRAVHQEYGGLYCIDHVVKLNGYVNTDETFHDQHLVINGASRLLLDVLGESGEHSRTALGVAMIPLNACVEVEIVFMLKKGTGA